MSPAGVTPSPLYDHPVELVHLLLRAVEDNSTTNSTSSSTSSTTAQRPSYYKAVGISLAVASGLFIGTSFVLKKYGLLAANKKYNEAAGDGYGYLKNVWWWSGMILMIVGEICNFVAYSFVDAILVTPLGALTVVVTTILSAIFLKERLSFVGKVGCFNCIIGSVVIVMNAPDQSSVTDIQGMQHYVVSPGFLSYAGIILVGCAFVAFWVGPRYGKKSMLVYLSICSLIGGLSVVATQGLGAAIVAQIGGEEQYKHWFLYVLFVFVICTLLTEIIYLNKALNIFNAALVTPTYYVYFTSATLITSCVLFRGLHGATVSQIITIILGFLQICSGVVLLQLSKSSKDVPDAAVFSGDLDQIRTVAEVEEPESEPHADTVRGVAGLVRALSTTKHKREVEEVKRIREDSLAPIGENEQVEWDGLRRRKTVLSSHHSGSIRRQRTVHYPLGMSYFPAGYDETPRRLEDDDDEREHNPEDDLGFFPRFGRRAQTALSSLAPRSISGSRSPDPHAPHHASTMPLAEMRHTHPASSLVSPKQPITRTNLAPSPERPAYPSTPSGAGRPHIFGLPPGLRPNTTESLSLPPGQDTSYQSPSSHLTWAPTPSQLPPLSPFGPPAANRFDHNARTGSPLAPPPQPPTHVNTSFTLDTPAPAVAASTRRQFSFQTVFGGGNRQARSRDHSFDRSHANTHSQSQSRPQSHGQSYSNRSPERSRSRSRGRIVSGFGNIKRRSRPKTITEEERLGLVHVGSDAAQQDDDDDVSPAPCEDDRGRRDFSAGGESIVVRHTNRVSNRPGATAWRTDSDDDADEDEFGLARRLGGNDTEYTRIEPNTGGRPRSIGGQQGPPAAGGGQRGSRGRYGRDEDDEDDLGGRAFV